MSCTQAAFGVAVSGTSRGTRLYISDWYDGTISEYDALTDSLDVIVSEAVGLPASLFYSILSTLTHNGNSQHMCTVDLRA